MKVILSHPTGNANVRYVLESLIEKNLLETFYTGIACFADTSFNHIGKLTIFSEIRRRTFSLKLKKFTKTRPILEVARLASQKLKIDSFTKHESGIFCIDNIYLDLDRYVSFQIKKKAIKNNLIVYSYEDCALNSFLEAKKNNITCVYDLPIAYWATGHKLMTEEAERSPNWAQTLGGGINDSQAKLERKVQELELADMIVTPSNFVSDSLPEFAKTKKIVISTFGTPVSNNYQKEKDFDSKRPLRVLFVGSMGQRKGLGDLFAAMRLLKGYKCELIVMGSLLAPLEFYKKEFPEFIYEPGRQHTKVLELMRSCDVFCLPSIVEGRALVMQEAMSQGLPLIITPNTGGDDLIIEGKTGFLIPIRSPHIIAEKLNWFLENRELIPQMGRLSQLHAAEYTWENYGKKITQSISNLVA